MELETLNNLDAMIQLGVAGAVIFGSILVAMLLVRLAVRGISYLTTVTKKEAEAQSDTAASMAKILTILEKAVQQSNEAVVTSTRTSLDITREQTAALKEIAMLAKQTAELLQEHRLDHKTGITAILELLTGVDRKTTDLLLLTRRLQSDSAGLVGGEE